MRDQQHQSLSIISLIGISTVFLLVYGLWLWNYDLWHDVEALPGTAVRDMIAQGNWLTPLAPDQLLPPFYLWLAGICSTIFQSTHPGILRLPTVLSSVLLLAITARTVSRYLGPKTGVITAFIAGTTFFYSWYSIRLCVYMTGALLIVSGTYLLFDRIQRPDHTNGWKGHLAFFLLGLAYLTVGPFAFIPLAILPIYQHVVHPSDETGPIPWISGFMLLTLPIAAWIIPVYVQQGPEWVRTFLHTQTVDLATGALGDEESFMYYPVSFFVQFFPWSPFLVLGAISYLRSHFPPSFVTFHWFFGSVFIVLLSPPVTKQGLFLLPVIPIFSVTTAHYIVDVVLRRDTNPITFSLCFALLGVLAVGGGGWLAFNGKSLLLQEIHHYAALSSPELVVTVLSGVLVIGGISLLITSFRTHPIWPVSSMVAGVMVFMIAIKLLVLPILDGKFSVTVQKPAKSHVQNLSLTWEQQNMVNTMTINFQTPLDFGASNVYYDTESGNGSPNSYQHRVQSQHQEISSLKRSVHSVTLTNLQPDTTYYFIAGSDEQGYSDEYSFRTLPEKGKPIRFVAGGDQGTSRAFEQLNRIASEKNPHFVLIGGDMAYADGNPRNVEIWEAWYRIWNNSMRGPNGRLIPMILALGNHEVNNELAKPLHQHTKYQVAPFFFHYFNQGPQNGYFTKKIRNQLLIITLDTGFYTPVSRQSTWIKKQFRANSNSSFKIALYHNPIYPAVKSVNKSTRAMRKQWVPLFDRYNLDVAFEHDGHVFKRTHPLRNHEIHHERGIPYLGEGSWGFETRSPKTNRRYLKKSAGKFHFWYGKLHDEKLDLRALDRSGNILDRLTVTPD